MSSAAGQGSGRVSEAVSRVEAELAKLWAAPDDATGAPKVRASMMNLVVVAGSAEIPRLEESTDELTQTHPGRVFLLTVDGRIEPWDIRTSISAVCRADGGTLLCSDRVEIAFGAMVVPRAASIVGALALSEVPTVVESAAGAPAALVDALAREASRVVVDSAATPWKRIAQLAGLTGAPIADRNFVRGYTWRDLVARFFDEAPEAARGIRRVEVARTRGGKQEPAALIVGWLASRLGWKLEAGSRATDSRGQAIELALSDDPRTDIEAGELTAVRLETALGSRSLSCACARNEAPRVVRWTLEGARTVAHDHPLGYRDETWVLIKAIDGAIGDGVYRQTALAAAAFCDLLGGS